MCYLAHKRFFGKPQRVPSFQTFKLDEDSDQSFAGMAAICAARAGVNPHLPEVLIKVKSGAQDEIDSIKIID